MLLFNFNTHNHGSYKYFLPNMKLDFTLSYYMKCVFFYSVEEKIGKWQMHIFFFVKMTMKKKKKNYLAISIKPLTKSHWNSQTTSRRISSTRIVINCVTNTRSAIYRSNIYLYYLTSISQK